MTRIIKTLLLWLLMAALPVQGLAAVMKASCGPAHHASGPAVIMADGHHHAHASDGHRHHHDAAKHAAADGAHADKADDSATAHTVHKSSYCSACAACCVGAVAPPSVSLRIPDTGSTETVLNSPDSLVTGFVPAGPERPPRKISA